MDGSQANSYVYISNKRRYGEIDSVNHKPAKNHQLDINFMDANRPKHKLGNTRRKWRGIGARCTKERRMSKNKR